MSGELAASLGDGGFGWGGLCTDRRVATGLRARPTYLPPMPCRHERRGPTYLPPGLSCVLDLPTLKKYQTQTAACSMFCTAGAPPRRRRCSRAWGIGSGQCGLSIRASAEHGRARGRRARPISRRFRSIWLRKRARRRRPGRRRTRRVRRATRSTRLVIARRTVPSACTDDAGVAR